MINVIGLSLRLGNFFLKNVNFKIANRECLSILGPNGCGKTTLLECIAGLFNPQEGKIIIDDVEVTNYPPEKRKIGYVPQDFVLFPHLTADQNIAFGLTDKSEKNSDITNKVMHLLDIESLVGRDVQTLSAGERQKTALARALAINPKVLLLDEPFSNLDPLAREKLRRELKNILIKIITTLDLPVVYVTHNLSEALLMSDKMAVMSRGKIEQVGLKNSVIENPKSHFVAKFLGFNVFEGRVISLKDDCDTVIVDVSGVSIRAKAEKIALGGEVNVVLKPQDVLLSCDSQISKPKWKNCRCNTLRGNVIEISNMGSMARVFVDVGFQLKSDVSIDFLDELNIIEGDKIFVQFRAQKTKLIPKLKK